MSGVLNMARVNISSHATVTLLSFKGPPEIEGAGRFNDEDHVALGGDELSHGLPVAIGVVEVGDVVDVGKPQGLDLRREGLTMIDDMVGAQLEAPRAALGAGRGGDDGEARKFGELNSHRADASGTADDQDRAAGVVGIEIDIQSIKQTLPSGETGQRQGGAGGGVEGLRSPGGNPFVDQLKVRVGAGTRDIAGVINGVANFEVGDGVTDRRDDTRCVIAEGLGLGPSGGSHLGVNRVETDGFDLHEKVVSLGRGGGKFDFEGDVGVIESESGLKLDGFHGGETIKAFGENS